VNRKLVIGCYVYVAVIAIGLAAGYLLTIKQYGAERELVNPCSTLRFVSTDRISCQRMGALGPTAEIWFNASRLPFLAPIFAVTPSHWPWSDRLTALLVTVVMWAPIVVLWKARKR
jgi:hypothetical protein